MVMHQYIIVSERGYDSSKAIRDALQAAKNPAILEYSFGNERHYATPKRFSKGLTEKIRSLVSVRNVTEISDRL